MKELIATDTRVAAAVAAATTSTGLGTVLQWIPGDIGRLASVVGIVLSCVVIWARITHGRLTHKKLLLELEILEAEKLRRAEAERIED